MRHTHAAMSRELYNPRLQRHPDMFIGTNMSNIADGFVPPEVRPIFLNLATDSPERIARRDLLAEAIVATHQLEDGHPKIAKFRPPAHVSAADRAPDALAMLAVLDTAFATSEC